MTRYVAYVRISSEDQVGNFSLDAQQHAIEKWIADQEGRLVHTYVDEGYSGLTTDRPAFTQMRHDARQAKFDAIVVHKFDRFARNHGDAIALKALFRYELNVKIYSVTEPSEDSDGAMGLLMESMIEGVIDWYSKNLSKETAKDKKERARQGYHNNRPPFGMDKDENGILVPNQHELIGLLQAYESYATGNYSDTDVAHQLNDAGYRSKTGRKFSTDTVRDMLQNRIYLGYVKYQPYKKNADGSRSYKSEIQWFDGLHDAIIPQSLFDKVQEMRAKRRPKVLKDWHHNRTYLLSNLIYCADCVQNIPQDVTYDSYGKMRVQKLRGVSRYRCRARDLGYTCGQNPVNAVEIENQVINIIKNLQLSTDGSG
ncbi:MAG: recombinase family protein [Chloroflexota bacterium]